MLTVINKHGSPPFRGYHAAPRFRSNRSIYNTRSVAKKCRRACQLLPTCQKVGKGETIAPASRIVFEDRVRFLSGNRVIQLIVAHVSFHNLHVLSICHTKDWWKQVFEIKSFFFFWKTRCTIVWGALTNQNLHLTCIILRTSDAQKDRNLLFTLHDH